VQGPVVVTYVYQLVDGEVSPPSEYAAFGSELVKKAVAHVQVKVDKVEYRRPEPPKETAQNPSASSLVPTGW
jgi:hypothetical protein